MVSALSTDPLGPVVDAIGAAGGPVTAVAADPTDGEQVGALAERVRGLDADHLALRTGSGTAPDG